MAKLIIALLAVATAWNPVRPGRTATKLHAATLERTQAAAQGGGDRKAGESATATTVATAICFAWVAIAFAVPFAGDSLGQPGQGQVPSSSQLRAGWQL